MTTRPPGGSASAIAIAGVAGERADLQDPLRARDRDEQREESSLDRADHHPGARAERDVGRGRDLRSASDGGVLCAAA